MRQCLHPRRGAAGDPARTDKIIRLAEDDPRTLAIKAETLFRWNWNFQRVSRVSGRAMSYRKHANDRILLAFTEKNHDDGTGPILDAFFTTLTASDSQRYE